MIWRRRDFDVAGLIGTALRGAYDKSSLVCLTQRLLLISLSLTWDIIMSLIALILLLLYSPVIIQIALYN